MPAVALSIVPPNGMDSHVFNFVILLSDFLAFTTENKPTTTGRLTEPTAPLFVGATFPLPNH
jgi:hypothetical protein